MIIGLTGGIASGKSTVANWLKEQQYTVIDADISARTVVEPGKPAFNQIIKTFGQDILSAEGGLDRAKLGAVIFNDEDKRKQLNEIVHPAVRADMLAQKEQLLNAGKQTIIMDIPLLFESKLQWMVDKIIVVFVEAETQKERLMKRNQYTEEEAQARISSQLSLAEKAKQGDAVINNGGTIEESIEQLIKLLKEWKAKP
ncbi:dephospho-CoA kinase [Jeotgalibacillus soli]|nr:dephospho-CoA kinase [Jeotgalibacillus soli]